MKNVYFTWVRIALMLGAIIAYLGPPTDSFACSYMIGVDDIIVPWTPDFASDCSVQGYGINWIGITILSAISIVLAFVIKRSIRNRKRLFG